MAVFLLNFFFFFFSTAKNGESLGDMAGVTAACLFFFFYPCLFTDIQVLANATSTLTCSSTRGNTCAST